MRHRRKSYSTGGIIVVAMALASAAWSADAPKAAAPARANFRTDSTLVLVPVTVVDRRGAIVNGLAGGAFTVTEDGAQRPANR